MVEWLLPPQATSAAQNRQQIAAEKQGENQRRSRLRLHPASRSRNPASGMKPTGLNAAEILAASLVLGFSPKEAALDGTLTFRLKATALLLGVIVGGVKLQVAPVGRDLCRHDSVIG